jgi:hypothetical protein
MVAPAAGDMSISMRAAIMTLLALIGAALMVVEPTRAGEPGLADRLRALRLRIELADQQNRLERMSGLQSQAIESWFPTETSRVDWGPAYGG